MGEVDKREVKIEWTDGVTETFEAEGVNAEKEDGIYILVNDRKAMWINKSYVRCLTVTSGGEENE